MKLSRIALTAVLACSLLAACAANPVPPQQSRLPTASRPPVVAPQADSVGCLDTLRANDSISVAVKLSVRPLSVRPRDGNSELPAEFEEFFIEEFASRFKAPAPLSLSVIVDIGCPSAKFTCPHSSLWLSTTAYAVARADGSLSHVRVVDESLTPSLSDTVRAVLESMSRDRAMSGFPGDSLPVQIALRIERPDTVVSGRPLFRVRMPRYDVEFTRAKMGTGNFRGPKYPLPPKRLGIGDTVVMSYTVLRNGLVDPRSLDFHRGQHADFVRSVFDWIETATYEPARLGKCPVAAWARQTFIFVPRR